MVKRIVCPKKCFGLIKFLGPNRIYGPKKCWAGNIFGLQKSFGPQKTFCLNKYLGPNIFFGLEKMLCQKKVVFGW